MTQTSEKRIYSLNLGAYLLSTTHIIPEIRRDEETGSFYLIFPQTEEIKKAFMISNKLIQKLKSIVF